MSNKENNELYFQHLTSISFLGRWYKKLITSPLIYLASRQFGARIVEVGSGIGSGILGGGAKVVGLDINPLAVNYCIKKNMNAKLILDDGSFPLVSGGFDVCVLDNVLEHINCPKKTLDECYRITHVNGGLVVVVPGVKGYNSDSDHKIFYDEAKLKNLDSRFLLTHIFALPTIIQFNIFSLNSTSYCLLAMYKKLP